jgi:hypothetical protein
MSKLWTMIALAGLLALCGCPKQAGESAAGDGQAEQEVAIDSEAPAAQAAADAAAPEVEAEQAPGVSAGARRPSKEELQGKWFALYGGRGPASRTYTYENGHILEFMSSGIAMWTVTGDGGNGLQLASNWDMSNSEISLAVEKPGELNSPSIEITPLAFGRDDEVGLTSGGGEGAVDNAPVVFRYSPRLAGPYLALEGRQGELMVYGRVENNAPDSAPDLSGRWKVNTSAGAAEAEVALQDGRLQVSWGSPLRSTFSGTYTNGYFVGTVSSSAGSAFAALIPAAGGSLDGVISTEPYSKMETAFELVRGS